MRSVTGCSATPWRNAPAAPSGAALAFTTAFKLPLGSCSVAHASPAVRVTPSHRAGDEAVSPETRPGALPSPIVLRPVRRGPHPTDDEVVTRTAKRAARDRTPGAAVGPGLRHSWRQRGGLRAP